MFCAKCSYEYHKGFSVCPDCNADLVDKLPEKQPEIIETSLVTNKAISD